MHTRSYFVRDTDGVSRMQCTSCKCISCKRCKKYGCQKRKKSLLLNVFYKFFNLHLNAPTFLRHQGLCNSLCGAISSLWSDILCYNTVPRCNQHIFSIYAQHMVSHMINSHISDTDRCRHRLSWWYWPNAWDVQYEASTMQRHQSNLDHSSFFCWQFSRYTEIILCSDRSCSNHRQSCQTSPIVLWHHPSKWTWQLFGQCLDHACQELLQSILHVRMVDQSPFVMHIGGGVAGKKDPLCCYPS